MEPNWALIACGIAERTDTDLNTVDPTGDPKFPYNILIRNLMLGLQNAYRDGTKNTQEWLPIADAPTGGYHKPVRLWADGYPLWVAGFWLPIPMVWASFAGLGTLHPQPTHFQHFSPPPENTP